MRTPRDEVDPELRLRAALLSIYHELHQLEARTDIAALTCDTLVMSGGLRSAWLGWLDEQTRAVQILAARGGEQPTHAALSQSLTAAALQEGRPSVCDMAPSDSASAREHSAASAVHAAAAFPIRQRGIVRGVLHVTCAAPSGFLSAHAALLANLADDLGLWLCMDHSKSAVHPVPAEFRIEARYQALFDHAPDGILIADRRARCLDVNPSMCRTLGYARQELLGQHLSAVVAPEEVDLIAAAVETISATSDYKRLWLLRRKDGSTFPAEVIATVTPTGSLLGMVRDVTERKAVERALREREAQLRIASHVAKLGVWSVDLPEGRIHWSDELAAMRGLPLTNQPSVSSALEFYAPEFRQALIEKGEACARHGTPFEMEIQALRPDGRRFWIRVLGEAERDAAGHLIRMYGTVQDIDEERGIQEQLRQAQKMEAVGQLAGGVAHDFNNMLSVILSYAELAQQKLTPDSPGFAELVEICRAAERSAELTRDLLTFSRKQMLAPRKVQIAQIVAGMESMLRRLLNEDIELELKLRSAQATALVDPKQIEQIVLNLAVNARDAMPDGGKLLVEVAEVELDAEYASLHMDVRPDTYVMLAVTDTGTGMDAATRERIFEPFFTTKEPGKGTGLGLSTVFGIVKQSRGHLTVDSEPGHGSTFKIYLPRADEGTQAPARHESPSSLAGHETVLLVEDEADVRRVIAEILKRYGYHVLVARDVDDAIEITKRHEGSIDLLLTDIVMAPMSGRELAKHLASARPTMRVLYVSGYAPVHHDVLEAGIAFLQKPITPRTLCRKVREVLDAV